MIYDYIIIYNGTYSTYSTVDGELCVHIEQSRIQLLALSKANLEIALRMKTEELDNDCPDSFLKNVCNLEQQYRH